MGWHRLCDRVRCKEDTGIRNAPIGDALNSCSLLATIGALLAVVTFVDVVLWPHHNVALLYALPVIFATVIRSIPVVLAVAALAGALVLVDAAVARSSVNVWALLLLTVIVSAYLLNCSRRPCR